MNIYIYCYKSNTDSSSNCAMEMPEAMLIPALTHL